MNALKNTNLNELNEVLGTSKNSARNDFTVNMYNRIVRNANQASATPYTYKPTNIEALLANTSTSNHLNAYLRTWDPNRESVFPDDTSQQPSTSRQPDPTTRDLNPATAAMLADFKIMAKREKEEIVRTSSTKIELDRRLKEHKKHYNQAIWQLSITNKGFSNRFYNRQAAYRKRVKETNPSVAARIAESRRLALQKIRDKKRAKP